MPIGPSRNSPSLRSRRGMHRRTVTGVSERTFARRNSSTNCLISHSPRTQRLVKEAVRDAGRPGRGSSPRSSRLAPDGHLRGRLASGPAARLAGPGRHGRAGPLARVRQRAGRAARPCHRGGGPLHAIRLANAVADQARRQLKQATMGHRGRTYDPPYRIRKLLVTAAEQLTQRGRARLRARDTMKIERGADRTANLDSTRWPLSWGVASRYRTAGRADRSSPATSEIPHPPGSPRDTPDVTGVAPAGRWARHQTDERGGALSPPVYVTGVTVADGLVQRCSTVGRPPRGGGLSSCRTTPLATCRWPG